MTRPQGRRRRYRRQGEGKSAEMERFYRRMAGHWSLSVSPSSLSAVSAAPMWLNQMRRGPWERYFPRSLHVALRRSETM